MVVGKSGPRKHGRGGWPRRVPRDVKPSHADEDLAERPERVLRALERSRARLEWAEARRTFASEEEREAFTKAFMAAHVEPLPDDLTPLEKAQELIYDAFDTPRRDKQRRIQLARKALELSPDCADAYAMLAEFDAETPEASRELFQKGVEAGERALGPERFREYTGDFWGIVRTRGYMRARSGLAQTLWALGEKEAAIAHLWDMLRLNPEDHQNMQSILAEWLLELHRDDELMALFDRYKEHRHAQRLYDEALLTYRRTGDSLAANGLLRRAVAENPHVPDFLLGRVQVPSGRIASYKLGGGDEAILYAQGRLRSWRDTLGALAWLAEQTASSGDR